MKTKLYAYLLLFFCCAITLQCKKTGYEEGPKRSLRSTIQKLALTKWELEYYEINGVDSFTNFKLSPFCKPWEFSDIKDKDCQCVYVNTGGTNNDENSSGYTTNQNSNTLLILGAKNGMRYNPYKPDTVIYWQIIKFYPRKNLWLKTTYNHINYFLKFKRIEK